MSVIACGVNIFDYDQTVYLMDNDGKMEILGKSTYDNLDHFITTMCNEHKVYRVQLKGLVQYTSQLKKRIEAEGVARYGKRIEVKI